MGHLVEVSYLQFPYLVEKKPEDMLQVHHLAKQQLLVRFLCLFA